MNETEISLKLAEAALSKARAETFDDLIKIGIPSLIALAGIISTFCLTKSGHKKDISIQKIINTHDTEKEKNDRTGELIKNITLKLTSLHANTLKYTSLLCAKLDLEKDGHSLPADKRLELSQDYHDLLDSLHEMFQTEAEIYLLGVKEISDLYTNYQSTLIELHTTYGPSSHHSALGDLTTMLGNISSLREKLFNLLSNNFLLKS